MPEFYNRTDEYGGSIEEGVPCPDIKAIKVSLRSGFPVVFRIKGTEMVSGGRCPGNWGDNRLGDSCGCNPCTIGMPESGGVIYRQPRDGGPF